MTPCILLLGPTASGKSAVAHSHARHIHGELGIADTAQVYVNTGQASGRAFREHNLARFRAGQAATEPWPDDDPVFQPRSAAASVRSS